MAIFKMYAPFFSGSNWIHVLTSGKDWLVILTLILMECLLSVDNAVVLAAQTKVLPDKKQQEKSLFYGLWGAYIFRFIVIGIGTYLINFWEIKLAGSLYLFYLSFKFFSTKGIPKRLSLTQRLKVQKLLSILPKRANIFYHFSGGPLFQLKQWISFFQLIQC